MDKARAHARIAFACALVIVGALWVHGAQSQTGGGRTAPAGRTIAVDWSDPEIAAFIRDRTTRPPQSLTPADEGVLSRLRLPVLAFDRPPGLVSRAFSAQAMPERQRQIVTDPDNPVWYTIIDTYAGVTVAVDADLRVQKVLPPNAKIYRPPPGAAVTPQISVLDKNVEEGMEGLIAEYTVRKFPDIPYRVTIECTRQTRQFCADSDALLRDREGLQIISARPPG